MIGNNSLVLNEATMKAAIQFWLNSKFVENAPTVSAVKGDGNGLFTITLTDVKP